MKGTHTLKKAKKSLAAFLAVTLVAFALELFVFNFQSFREMASSAAVKDCTLTLEDFDKLNWTEQQDGYVSEADPILVYAGLNSRIDRLTLSFTAEGAVPYVDLFYTDENTSSFSGDRMTRVPLSDGNSCTVTLNATANDLRIDLGDDPGLRLQALTVTINSTQIHLSAARIIAVIVIFFLGRFLFSLQREPDYGLPEQIDSPAQSE